MSNVIEEIRDAYVDEESEERIEAHWDGCHQVHSNCAIVKLLKHVDALTAANDDLCRIIEQYEGDRPLSDHLSAYHGAPLSVGLYCDRHGTVGDDRFGRELWSNETWGTGIRADVLGDSLSNQPLLFGVSDIDALNV